MQLMQMRNAIASQQSASGCNSMDLQFSSPLFAPSLDLFGSGTNFGAVALNNPSSRGFEPGMHCRDFDQLLTAADRLEQYSSDVQHQKLEYWKQAQAARRKAFDDRMSQMQDRFYNRTNRETPSGPVEQNAPEQHDFPVFGVPSASNLPS